jgi:hypothetical protein
MTDRIKTYRRSEGFVIRAGEVRPRRDVNTVEPRQSDSVQRQTSETVRTVVNRLREA